jgi:hypothetical protein
MFNTRKSDFLRPRRAPSSPLDRAVQPLVEGLENRVLFCYLHEVFPAPIELGSTPGPSRGGPETAADIVWSNRGSAVSDTDGFNGVFGASANTARAVVDQVILDFERMIGAFNYGNGTNTYTVSVSMRPPGAANNFIGASAGVQFTLGNKPIQGTVNIGRGEDGLGAGWWLDPTPADSSEFNGNIVNAFAGDAPAGSPANGVSDFYTVVAAEMTHCMGLLNNHTLFASHQSFTAVPDTAEGGGTGFFYTFTGPSIKHLLTSNNGGPGGQSFTAGTHGAGPENVFNGQPVSVTLGPDTYVGAEDIGNALFEDSRRYLVSNVYALMFKDAFAYSTVDPAQFGTMYSNLNRTTGELLVRGGSGTSDDTITISRSGNTLTVSVDPANDVAGTGSLPGAGNLPAFVTTYDLSQTPITSITVDGGDGNDTINIDGLPASVAVSVTGGNGNDNFSIGGGNLAANVLSPVDFQGNAGVNTITFNDQNSAGNLTYNLDADHFNMTGSVTITYLAVRPTVNANAFNDTINVLGLFVASQTTINAGDGNDSIVYDLASPNGYASLSTVNGQGGNDTLFVNEGPSLSGFTYTITGTTIGRSGLATVTYATLESVKLTAGAGNNTVNVNSTTAGTPVTVDGAAGTDTINVNETAAANGPVTILSSIGDDVVNVNTDGAGVAQAVFASALTQLGMLSVNTGGLATVAAGADKVLVTRGLSLAGSGALDLADNDMIVDYTGDTLIASIRAALASGYAGGSWNGAGIQSSAAHNDPQHRTALGYAEAAELFTFPATFSGVPIDNTTVVIKHTFYGDADLSGGVNLLDFNRLAASFGSGSSWTQGNFNYDATVDLLDFNGLALNFGQSGLAPDAAASLAASLLGRPAAKPLAGISRRNGAA